MTSADDPARTDTSELRPATVTVHAGRPPVEPNRPMNAPVVMTSTYVATPITEEPGDLGYGRWTNPTWAALEEALGALEGGDALSFASGMGAISTLLEEVPVGGTLVIPRGPYSGTLQLARQRARSGHLVLREVDITDPAAVAGALDGADLMVAESPSNPMLDVADLRALAAAARERNVLLAVDNTFATPVLQRPLDLGADVVVHSATKYLGGHSDVLLGALVTRDDELRARLHGRRTLLGAIPGPWEAWLVLRGLRTLSLRVERAGANAAELARRLADHPGVARVRHPSLPGDPGHELAKQQMTGFGAIVRVDVAGGPERGAEAAERVCAATRLWVHTTSLGGVESTLERRRRHTAEAEVVPPELLRLSVGIEDVEDLWADLDQALNIGRIARSRKG